MELVAVAYWRLARVLRFELRETQRAVTLGGYRIPERESQPEMHDFIFEQIQRDPQVLPAKLDSMLKELETCRAEVDAKGYLEKSGMDRLKRIPGRYYESFMTWNLGAEMAIKKAKLYTTVPEEFRSNPAWIAANKEKYLIETHKKVLEDAKQMPLFKLDAMSAELRSWKDIAMVVQNNPAERVVSTRPTFLPRNPTSAFCATRRPSSANSTALWTTWSGSSVSAKAIPCRRR